MLKKHGKSGKKRIVFRMSAIALCIAVFLTAFTVSDSGRVYADGKKDPAEVYREKLKAAQDLKAEYEKKKEEQEALIAEFTEEKNNIEAYITELDLEMNDISLAIFDLKNDIADTEKELEETRLELEAAKQTEINQYETMKKRIAYMYENGETTYIDVLLNSTGISDFLNQMEYEESIVEYDGKLLEKYTAAKENVTAHEAALEASLEELEALKKNAELEQETVEELMNLKAEEIEKLTEKLGIADEYLFNYMSEISNQEMEIEEIIETEQKRIEEEERKRKEEEERRRKEEEERKRKEEEERKRQEEERKKQQESGSIKTPASTVGYDADAIKDVVLTDETDLYSMIWPLPGDYRTFSRFGPRKAPLPGASTYHKGWDIGGEFGAPMVAVLAGKVVAASYNSSAGNFVKIEHQPGFVTVYCHCSKILVTEGSYVQQGQQIALVGSTGVSTSPHLHFAVQSDGTYIDPDPYIGYLVD